MQNLVAVSNTVCTHVEGSIFLERWDPPFGMGLTDPLETCPSPPVIISNLVVLGQRAWRTAGKQDCGVPPFKATQGHRNWHGSIGYTYDFLFLCHPSRTYLVLLWDKRDFGRKSLIFLVSVYLIDMGRLHWVNFSYITTTWAICHYNYNYMFKQQWKNRICSTHYETEKITRKASDAAENLQLHRVVRFFGLRSSRTTHIMLFSERPPIVHDDLGWKNRTTRCNRFWRAGCSRLEHVDIRLVY